ncbi:uncharacterized membrane protein YraQ (UPF0718 family) [Rhodoblastus acidophilus]|uniref:permease n=1 Tax=Rhodoblastus acidophilus TaxID=1074 RepID=UPI002224861A|nr:permease [Rhodoblastus acidophilus]MCW2285593.1 uncharacterized membrane protein YraQ (UPF0718 family) [Rhodoblastus acidophilus]MCW2334491.1 uncharacterized membrane protein YraQ (UPF0718 family) [Rhodoblastus acidophilus]
MSADVSRPGGTRSCTFHVVAAVALWFVHYRRLEDVSAWVVEWLPVVPNSRMEEAARFFVYDAPKVIMLLTLVVFAMGIARRFCSPKRTRALLAGRREGFSNTAAATLGVFTPFCSCSAAPLFVSYPLARR